MKHRKLDNINVIAARRLSADSWYINEARGLRTAYLSDLINTKIGNFLRLRRQRLKQQHREYPLSESEQIRINRISTINRPG